MNWLIVNKRLAILSLVIFLFGLVFIFVPIGVFPDSIVYYSYIKIFQGVDPISSWNLLRGPSFPFVIYLFVTFFGGAMAGLLIGAYVTFLGMVYSIHRVLGYFIRQFKINYKNKLIVYGLFLIMIVFNPIIFGYFHALLTEYLVMLLAILSCILAWLWIDVDIKKNRTKYLLLTLFFMVLTPFIWFIKQPYLTVAVFPWLIAAILSLSKKFNWQNLLQRLITLCAGGLVLLAAILAWQSFLVNNGVKTTDTDTGSGGFISYGIINGVSNAKLIKEPQITNDYIDNKYLSGNEIEKINEALGSSSLNVNLWVLYDNSGQHIIDELPIYFTGADIPLDVSIKAWEIITSKHPLSTVDSYVTNYLATSNFYDYGVNSNGQWAPAKNIGLYGHENLSIGMLFLTYPFNMSNWTSDRASNLGLIQIENKHIGARDFIFNIFGKSYLGLYIIVSLLLPLIFITTLIVYIRVRRRDRLNSNKIGLYELSIILLGFSLFNMLFNAFFGSLMDRYAYVGWPCVSFALILFAIVLINNVLQKANVKNPSRKTH